MRADWPTNDSYGGSGRPFFLVSAPEQRDIARLWIRAHKTSTADEVLAVVESLLHGVSHEERTLATLLLRYGARARQAATPAGVERWLGELNGWAEVDSLCQNLFTAEDLLADWPGWEGLLDRLTTDPNINKRRASLVLLTGPVHYSDDGRFAERALVAIDRLKAERPILITKAISWLMRCMTTRHRAAVERLIAHGAASLPKVAVRETRIKLATGTKSGRSKARSTSA